MVFTTAVASIDVPPGSKTQDWSINTGTLKSTPIAADPSSSLIEIVSEERQLVWAGNASNRLMMATIKEPGQNDVTLSALSTAITLLVLHPLLIQDYLSDPEGMRVQLKRMAVVQDFAKIIEAKVAENVIALQTDPVVQSSFQRALETAYGLLHPGSSNSEKVGIATEATGARVEKVRFEEKDGNLVLKVINPRGRWLQAVAETKDSTREVLDETLVSTGSFASLGLNLLSGSLGTEGEAELAYPSAYQNVRISLYAPGGFDWEKVIADGHPERTNFPLILSVIDNIVLPFIDIVSGWKGLHEGIQKFRHHGLRLFRQGSATDHWLKRWVKRVLIHSGLTIQGYGQSGERGAKLLKIFFAGLGALLEDDYAIFKDAALEIGMSTFKDIGSRLLSYCVPGFMQLWEGAKAVVAVANFVETVISSLRFSCLEQFDVANLPPAASLKAYAKEGGYLGDSAQGAVEIPFVSSPVEIQYFAGSDYLLLSHEWDFDGDGTVDYRSSSVQKEYDGWSCRAVWTYLAPGLYHSRVKVVDVDGAVAEKELVVDVYRRMQVKAEPLSESEIRLSWDSPANVSQGFEIARETGPLTFTPIGTVGSKILQFTESGLLPGTSYVYKVRPVGTTKWSDPAQVTTLEIPLPPASSSVVTASGSAQNSLPEAWVGSPYYEKIDSGVAHGASWVLATGSQLPPGLKLASWFGSIHGEPTVAGNYTFSVETASEPKIRRTLTLSVTYGLTLPSESLYDGLSGYSAFNRIYFHYGVTTGPHTVSLISGSLPKGASLKVAESGVQHMGAVDIVGSLELGTAGLYSFTIQVTSSEGVSVKQSFELTVKPSLMDK